MSKTLTKIINEIISNSECTCAIFDFRNTLFKFIKRKFFFSVSVQHITSKINNNISFFLRNYVCNNTSHFKAMYKNNIRANIA